MPGAFLLASTHICWLTPHHRAALKPSEEDETLAPSVFNGRWLGHERANMGGGGFRPNIPARASQNCSNKTLIKSSFMHTPETEQHWKPADLFNMTNYQKPLNTQSIICFSTGCLPFASLYSESSHMRTAQSNEDPLKVVQQVRPCHLIQQLCFSPVSRIHSSRRTMTHTDL